MNIHDIFGVSAGIVSALAFVPYFRAIFRRETTPHRVSWFLWSITAWLSFFSYAEVGAGATLWVTLSYSTCSTATFLLSLKFGEGGWSMFDKACLLCALGGLIVWGLTQSAYLGLVCFLTADLFAAMPTLLKSWSRPASEDKWAWTVAVVGSVLNVVAIDQFETEIVFYPIYMLVVNGSIWILTLRKPLRL